MYMNTAPFCTFQQTELQPTFFFLKQMLEVNLFILYSAGRIHLNFYQMNRLSNSGVKDIKCTINKLLAQKTELPWLYNTLMKYV